MRISFIKQLAAKSLFIGVFSLLAFLPLQGYALQVDLSADEGVPAMVVKEVETGIAKVEQFYQDYYGIDIDYPIKLRLVSDKERYIEAVMEEFNMSREDVEKYYYNTGGLTSGHTIVSDITAYPSSAARFKNIAHELTHQYEVSLGGASAHNLMWLSEGTADIMAVSVLSLNKIGSMNGYAKDCMSTLQSVPGTPGLANLRSWEDWIKQANITGLSVNYRTADEAVLFLLGKVGYGPIFTYYQLLGDTGNARQAFSQSFGINLEDFEEEFRAYLADKGINS